MLPNSSPRAFGGVKAPFQRLFLRDNLVETEFLISSGGCARAHPPGVAPEPFGGMVLFLQRLLLLSIITGSI